MKDFIRIRVADPANYARISKSSLERAVFERKRVAKRAEIARKDVDSSRVNGTQAFLAGEHMQRCAVLCAGFGQNERAVGKIEGCQTVAARQLCPWQPPVQPACNHQVQHQPKIAFYSNRDALADSPQFADDATLDTSNWWLCGSKQKRTRKLHSNERLRDDTRPKRT